MIEEKKKFRQLWPTSKCCMKRAFELNTLSKYGSLFTLSFFILLSIYNIITLDYFIFSFLSLLVNIYFLLVVLVKLEMINFNKIDRYLNRSLQFMIFLLILNALTYLISNSYIFKLVFAPISFLGAYFIFLLIKRDSI